MFERIRAGKLPAWPWTGLSLSAAFLVAIFLLPLFFSGSVSNSRYGEPNAKETHNRAHDSKGVLAVVKPDADDTGTQTQSYQYEDSYCIGCSVWEALGRFVDDLGDPVALFTGLLVIVSVWQGILILRAEGGTQEALRIASKQADAAFLSAKNLLRTTRPFIVLDSVTLQPFNGAVPKYELAEGGYLKSIHGVLKNQGTGTGFVKEARVVSSERATIGPMVEANDIGNALAGYDAIEAGATYSPGLPLDNIRLDQRFDDNLMGFYVWGWIRYSDIHGVVRRSGFAFEYIRVVGLPGTDALVVACGPNHYWYDVEEEADA